MSKQIMALIILTLLVGSVFAETYTIVAQVSDSKGRPVQGAAVNLNCEENVHSVPWDNGKIIPRLYNVGDTNSSGGSDMQTWQCTKGLPTSLTVKYQGMSITADFDLLSGTNTVSVNIPDLYDLGITVVDQNSKPIEGVQISGTPATSSPLKVLSDATDERGKVLFKQIPSGSDYLIRFQNGNEEKSFDISVSGEDSDFAVQMSTHTLTVRVVDDLNSSISGAMVNVSYNGKYTSGQTDASGSVSFNGLHPAAYSVATSYSSQSAQSDVEMDKDFEELVVFDIHGPLISDMRIEEKGSKESLYALAKASDAGSGLNTVRMFYSLNGATWAEIPVTLTGSGEYRGSIPPQEKDTQISYKVSALDNAGNKAEEEKKFVAGSVGCLPALILPLLLFVGIWLARGGERNG